MVMQARDTAGRRAGARDGDAGARDAEILDEHERDGDAGARDGAAGARGTEIVDEHAMQACAKIR
jgi:hypothetical protein